MKLEQISQGIIIKPPEVLNYVSSETANLLQWSDDGTLIALLNATPTICIYDAETFEIVKQIEHGKVCLFQ